MAELTNPMWETFCLEYVTNGFNRKEAALAAGYCKDSTNEASIYSYATELYNKEKIRTRIRELLAERRTEYAVTEARVIQELSRIAFVDVTDVFEEFEGGVVQYKNLKQIPKKVRAAIKSFKITQWGVNVEFHDKIGALNSIAQYLGIMDAGERGKRKADDRPTIYLPHNGRSALPESDEDLQDTEGVQQLQ